MPSSKPFFVDNMTAQEILSLGDDVLNKLSARDMSRALRTVALVANKRVNRLLNNAVKRNDGYIEKKSGKPIALDALNYVTNDGRQKAKFGVGNKNRNQMYAELSRIRNFMNMQTSTVKGALEVRKARDVRIMGKTREQAIKEAQKKYTKDYKKQTGKKPTKKNLQKIAKATARQFTEASTQAWATFRKFLELEGIPNSPYHHFYGSTEVLEMIGSRTAAGDSEQQVLSAAHDRFEQSYIEQQDELMNEIENDIGFEIEF